MQYYCDQSENSNLIVERFIETFDNTDQLFLTGPKGSEFDLLLKEYCAAKSIANDSVITVQPSILEEGVLGDLMVILSRTSTQPELMIVKVYPQIDEVSENKLIRFLENPAFHNAKLLVFMENFDPFEDDTLYSDQIVERCKESLFVLPPLKERLADLGYFTTHCLKQFEKEKSTSSPISFSSEALDLILSYDWPGNYDELYEVLRSLVYGSRKGGSITKDRLESALNLGRTVPIDG